jgi:hypothetical protein
MKLSRPWLAEELEALHPRARAALEALDAWASGQGWEELLVVELRSERDDWARADCSWCVRLRVYSRHQRQALLNQLRTGKRAPEWLALESGDVARCAYRDFPWRKERLGY